MEFFLFTYFQNGGKRVTKTRKVGYLSKYCFDLDDVYIKLYVFLGVESMCDAIGEVKGHAHLVDVKVILGK